MENTYIIHPWEPDFYLLLPNKSKIERKGPTSTSQPQRLLKETKEPLKGKVIITPLSC